jgi:autotransporter-associated beta strand protein
MKPKATLRQLLAIVGSSLLAISSATAADGTWSQTNAGPFDWGVSDNWTDGIIADGTDFTAFFTPNITANQTVNLEADRTIGNITFTDSSSSNNLTISGTGILTLDRTTGVPVIDVTQSGRALTISSQISGADGLQKEGAGVLLLNGTTSNYSGGTVITGGRLNAASDAALGNSNGSITLNGGTLGANTSTGTARQNGTNLVTARDIIVGASGGSIFVSKNNNFTTTGALSGSGAFTTANPGGSGGISLYRFASSANTFTGSMSLNVADVRVSSLGDTAGNNIVFTGADSAFRFNDTGATAGLTIDNRAFELSNVGATIDNLNATHALTINSNLVATGAAAKTLTLNSVAGPTNVFAGVIANETDGGTGTVALTKSGAGKWTLSGNNSYTGTTTVSGGTLVINGDQSLATGAVAVNSTSTLGGSGTIGGSVTVAATANLAPGASVGTLSIGGALSISDMAGGAGKLFYELGSIAASDKIAVTGTLDIGEGLLGFSDFDFSSVATLQSGTYTLITSNGLSGTLDGANLSGTIGSSEATLQINGNHIELVLAAAKPTTTLVIDLGVGSQIPGAAFGTFGALNLPIPPLPAGSILRSVEVNAVLQNTDNANFASDLAVLFDPTPSTPGGDFSVVMTNGAIKFGAPVQLGWPAAANSGPPTPLVSTKVAADWAAAGTIDLANTGIFLGNAYDNDTNESVQGGTWSGTITVTYDVAATSTPYEDWATGGELFDADANGDGVSNGLAFLLGASGPGVNALNKLPTATQNAGALVMIFQMLPASARGTAGLSLEYSNTLNTGSWTPVAVPDTSSTVGDVVFTITGTNPLNATATIPVSKADGTGKLFGRVKGTNP